MTFSMTDKRSAVDVYERESIKELIANKRKRTIDDDDDADDGVARSLAKKSKLIDEELPDVDDNEEFPQQLEERDDEELARGLADGRKELLIMMMANGVASRMESGTEGVKNVDLSIETMKDVDKRIEDDDDEEEEEEAEARESLAFQSCGIDIVDVDDDDGEEDGDSNGCEWSSADDIEEEEEEEDDEEEETAQAIARARNQREGRQLLQQLDGSTRSKLCLTVLEKYGEELLYGHEDARDAILVDACAQESVLSLMRDAIRLRDLYARGSSASAPVELDDDDGDDEEDEGEAGEYAVGFGEDDIEEEGEDEAGGYEDEVVDADDEEGTRAGEDEDDEIVVILEEEAEDRAVCKQDRENCPAETTHGCRGSEKEEEDAHLEKKLHPVDDVTHVEHDDDKFSVDNNEKEEDTDGRGAAPCVAEVLKLQMPIADSAT